MFLGDSVSSGKSLTRSSSEGGGQARVVGKIRGG